MDEWQKLAFKSMANIVPFPQFEYMSRRMASALYKKAQKVCF